MFLGSLIFCLRIFFLSSFIVLRFQINSSPFKSLVTNFLESGDQSTFILQLVCPVNLIYGISVLLSHNLTVLSPETLARKIPFGENYTSRTASVCPSKEELIHVMGLTPTIDSSRQLMVIVFSVDISCFLNSIKSSLRFF